MEDLAPPTGIFCDPKMLSAVEEVVHFLEAFSLKLDAGGVTHGSQARILTFAHQLLAAIHDAENELTDGLFDAIVFNQLHEKLETNVMSILAAFAKLDLPLDPEGKLRPIIKSILEDVARGVHTILMHLAYKRNAIDSKPDPYPTTTTTWSQTAATTQAMDAMKEQVDAMREKVDTLSQQVRWLTASNQNKDEEIISLKRQVAGPEGLRMEVHVLRQEQHSLVLGTRSACEEQHVFAQEAITQVAESHQKLSSTLR